MYVDSIHGGWGQGCEAAAEWRGFSQADTPLCLPWLLALVADEEREDQALSFWSSE